MVKSRYIGDGHPTFNRNPYNGYINPYYCVDDHPLLYGNNGNWSTRSHICLRWFQLQTLKYVLLKRKQRPFNNVPGGWTPGTYREQLANHAGKITWAAIKTREWHFIFLMVFEIIPISLGSIMPHIQRITRVLITAHLENHLFSLF